MWGHMDTEQISSLCGQSQQRWPVGESDMGNELEYWKSHRLGFTVVARVVENVQAHDKGRA